jgi:FKBP-type peptidyl-prolyl cis-trans isomerase FkpA
MQMTEFRPVLLLLLGLLLIACRGGNKESSEISTVNQAVRESLIEANKQLNLGESEEIDLYLLQKGLKMKQTGTGLRYLIQSQGTGKQASAGMRASVRFTLSLLNGKTCYSSDSTGIEEFLIDQDEVESGLHEGIKLLREGDRAKFILPSHLAHGLMGDNDCIPARSPVVYDIELLKLK